MSKQNKLPEWTELSTSICRDHRISRTALRTYIALNAFRLSNGIARPKHGELAALTQLTENGVSYAVDELATAGWIARKMGDDGLVHYYFLYPFADEEGNFAL